MSDIDLTAYLELRPPAPRRPLVSLCSSQDGGRAEQSELAPVTRQIEFASPEMRADARGQQ